MNSPEHISATGLARLIRTSAAPVIIDARSGYEYRRGHVPGALHLPFWKAFSLADGLALPKDRPVVIYCQHGPRAVIAGFALRRAGFTGVKYLEGHMNGWQKAGLPLETTPSR